jgi:hypothetical protein
MALEQSNVSVETYFQDQEMIEGRVMTRLANIFPHAYEKGKEGVYMVGQRDQRILKLRKGQLKEGMASYDVRVGNGREERQAYTRAKMIAQQKHQTGELSMKQLVQILGMESIKEMEEVLSDAEEKAREFFQQQQQANTEQQIQLQQQMKEFEFQTNAKLKEIDAQYKIQLEQVKMQADQYQAQLKAQVETQKAEAQAQQAAMKSADDRYAVDNETAIEQAYLRFEYDQLAINQANNKTKLLLDKADRAIKVFESRSKEKVKD